MARFGVGERVTSVNAQNILEHAKEHQRLMVSRIIHRYFHKRYDELLEMLRRDFPEAHHAVTTHSDFKNLASEHHPDLWWEARDAEWAKQRKKK